MTAGHMRWYTHPYTLSVIQLLTIATTHPTSILAMMGGFEEVNDQWRTFAADKPFFCCRNCPFASHICPQLIFLKV